MQGGNGGRLSLWWEVTSDVDPIRSSTPASSEPQSSHSWMVVSDEVRSLDCSESSRSWLCDELTVSATLRSLANHARVGRAPAGLVALRFRGSAC